MIVAHKLSGMTLTAIISAVVVGNSLAGTPEVACNWMTASVEVDGNLDEWQGMPTTFFEKERMVMGVGNDSGFLYLFFRSDNPNTIRIIQTSGISIWLDNKGKKKKDLCYHFRAGPTMDQLRQAGLMDTANFEDRPGDRQPSMMMGKMSREGSEIRVIDKHLDLEQIISIDGTNGPNLRFELKNGFCTYELSIPLQDHLVDYFGFNAKPGQKVGIGAKWGGRPENMDYRPSKQMGGGPGDGKMPGIGGGRSGGTGGVDGMRRGGPGDRMMIPEETEVWIKTVLAESSDNERDDN